MDPYIWTHQDLLTRKDLSHINADTESSLEDSPEAMDSRKGR